MAPVGYTIPGAPGSGGGYSPWTIDPRTGTYSWSGGGNEANNPTSLNYDWPNAGANEWTGSGSLNFPGTNSGNIYDPTTGFLDLYGTGAVGSGVPGAGPYSYGPEDPFDFYTDFADIGNYLTEY